MKLYLSVLFIFLFTTVKAQDTFIKAIEGANAGRNVRIIPTPDEGWVLFSLDSVKLYKFNKCGNIEWAKQYDIPTTYPGDFIRAKYGNFAYLTRVKINANIAAASLTMLNPAGNVLWSKTYEDPTHSEVPYSVSEDNAGNFFIFSNVTNINTALNRFHSIKKINPNGNISWARFYNELNPVWGGAIVTSDNGVLARTGDYYIKTDNAGAIQWVTSTYSSEPYRAPVEVSDGYILMGYKPATGKLYLIKLNKQGSLATTQSKYIFFAGSVTRFQKKANGNIALLFRQQFIIPDVTTLVEFDKDLNIVTQNSFKSKIGMANVQPSEFSITGNGNALIAGVVSGYKPGANASLFVARTNNLFQTGCDTTATITFQTEPATQTFSTTAVTAHPFTTVNHNITAQTIPATLVTLCGNNPVTKTLNIGQDTLICEGGALDLKNKSAHTFDSYLWSTGQTTATISITQPGKYWVKAGYSCNTEFASDTIVVQKVIFTQPALTTDSVFCSEPVLIDAKIPNATYRWQDGSTQPTYVATQPGNYFVDINLGNCIKRFEVPIKTFETLVMPNIFTPNNDQVNDRFIPKAFCGIASGTLTIYNRWGREVFRTQDLLSGWNGMNKEKEVAAGIYYWNIQYSNFRKEQKRQKGWLQLLNE